MRGRETAAAWGIAGIALVLVAWQLVASLPQVPDYVLPTFMDTVRVLAEEWPRSLARATAATVGETAVGILIGVVAAVGVAVPAALWPGVARATQPLLVASQAVPVMVFAPILTIVGGYGLWPKAVVVALLCFFPVAMNLIAGTASVSARTMRTMRSLGAGRWALCWRVRMPAAMPHGFTGAKVAVAFAPVAAVFGEYAGSSDGLGYLMMQAIPRLRTDFVFAEVLVLTAMTAVLVGSVALLQRLCCGWSVAERGEDG